MPFTCIIAKDSASGKKYYGFSLEQGIFNIGVDSGRYKVETLLAQEFLMRRRQVCPPSGTGYTADFAGPRDTVAGLAFAIQEQACARLEVAVGSNRRRRCIPNSTVISYVNSGQAPQAGVVAHLQLPRYLHLLSADKPYNFNTQDSSYSFAIGTLAAGQAGRIVIRDSVACAPGIMGLEQCTKAWLTPAPEACAWPQGYDGSFVEATGYCQQGRPTFTLRNTGQSMARARRLRLWQDSVLVYERPYRLDAGDTLALAVSPLSAATMAVVEVEQDSLSPRGRWQRAWASCLTLSQAGGQQVQLPGSDSPIEARECLPIRDSYDPNDKQVDPKGIGTAGNIEPGTRLRYRLRFMNKGNDTAFAVRITDMLSLHLDLSTLRFGAASHPYRASLSGEGRPVLTFTFPGIQLPDSTRSGQASQGFIDFSILPTSDAPLGTRIENNADIYFDFNDPVRTNTVVNTLYRPVVDTSRSDSVQVITSARKALPSTFSARPNPSSGQLELTAQAAGKLEVRSAQGALLRSAYLPKGTSYLDLSALPRGLYLLRMGNQSLRWVRE